MSEKNIFLNTDSIQLKNEEIEIIENFSKEKFFNDIQRLGVNLENLDKLGADKEVFNWVLKCLKEKYNYNIYECVLYLEKDYIPLKKLLTLLDDSVKQIMKEEMAKVFNIKILRTKLQRFFM